MENIKGLNLNELYKAADAWAENYPQIRSISLHYVTDNSIFPERYAVVWNVPNPFDDIFTSFEFIIKTTVTKEIFNRNFIDVYESEDVPPNFRKDWMLIVKKAKEPLPKGISSDFLFLFPSRKRNLNSERQFRNEMEKCIEASERFYEAFKKEAKKHIKFCESFNSLDPLDVETRKEIALNLLEQSDFMPVCKKCFEDKAAAFHILSPREGQHRPDIVFQLVFDIMHRKGFHKARKDFEREFREIKDKMKKRT